MEENNNPVKVIGISEKGIDEAVPPGAALCLPRTLEIVNTMRIIPDKAIEV
jgi:hypothetical protein